MRIKISQLKRTKLYDTYYSNLPIKIAGKFYELVTVLRVVNE